MTPLGLPSFVPDPHGLFYPFGVAADPLRGFFEVEGIPVHVGGCAHLDIPRLVCETSVPFLQRRSPPVAPLGVAGSADQTEAPVVGSRKVGSIYLSVVPVNLENIIAVIVGTNFL